MTNHERPEAAATEVIRSNSLAIDADTTTYSLNVQTTHLPDGIVRIPVLDLLNAVAATPGLAGSKVLVVRVRASTLGSDALEMPDEPSILSFASNQVCIDTGAHEIFLGTKLVDFRPREFALMTYLARNAGRVRTFQQIIDNVWEDPDTNLDCLSTAVCTMRNKMGDPLKRAIETKRGVGYTALKVLKELEDGYPQE